MDPKFEKVFLSPFLVEKRLLRNFYGVFFSEFYSHCNPSECDSGRNTNDTSVVPVLSTGTKITSMGISSSSSGTRILLNSKWS